MLLRTQHGDPSVRCDVSRVTSARPNRPRREKAGSVGERADEAKSAKPPRLGRLRKTRSPNCKRKGNLRGKRPDPSRQVSGRPKAGAALTENGGDAKRACRRVPTQSGVRATAVVRRTGPRGLTRRIAGGNAHDGPAMRPRPSLAAKNGVGDPAASLTLGAQCRRSGKRAWRTPTPQFGPGTARFPGLVVFGIRERAGAPRGARGHGAGVPMFRRPSRQTVPDLTGGLLEDRTSARQWFARGKRSPGASSGLATGRKFAPSPPRLR